MIYLDHNATTPITREVLDAMMPYLTSDWGNPSSAYKFGSRLKCAIEVAREQVAELIEAYPNDVIFTSCATESNNAAIHAALMANHEKRHIVTSATEHSSVLNYCNVLEKHGYRVSYLPVDKEGLLSLADLEATITNETAIVSLMWANNETGVLLPVDEIARSCHSHGVLFHCDAVQAVGKIPVNIHEVEADYLSISGHKLGAPKGIGALYIRSGAPFHPLINGGGQEQARRGGTENIPYIVGLGVAAKTVAAGLSGLHDKVKPIRDALEIGIIDAIPGASVNGHLTARLPNTANIHLPGLSNTAVLVMLDQAGICASSGSACMNSSITPSHVITAMTNSRKHAEESIRFSLGTTNTVDEVNEVVETIRTIAKLMG